MAAKIFSMKGKGVFQFLLMLLLVSCSNGDSTKESELTALQTLLGDRVDQLALNDAHKSNVLLRDFGSVIAIFHKESGEFVFFQDCDNKLDFQEDKLFKNAYVLMDWETSRLIVSNTAGKILLLVGADMADKKAEHTIDGIVHAYGRFEANNPDFSYLDSIDEQQLLRISKCQCISETSSSCYSARHDPRQSPCTVGGEGASKCSASESQAAKTDITITKIGFPKHNKIKGCHVSCNVGTGFYACCEY